MTHLAVAIAAADTDSALAAMHQAAAVAGLAELRLDLMQQFDLPRLLAARPLPVIVTCRPAREGGAWYGVEAQRLAVLRQAAALGADYIDLEWDCAAAAATLDRSRTKLILSRHDFTGMPADLPALAASLWAAGADVVKIVGAAARLADVAPVLWLLDAATRPTIAIAMGACGLASRLLAFRYRNAFLSFAAPDDAALSATAAGQISARVMRDVYRVAAMNKRTRLIGVVSRDAERLGMTARGNRWLARQGLDAVLLPLQVAADEEVEDALAAISGSLPWRGYLLEPPFGCAAQGEQVGNTLRVARRRQQCARIDDIGERLGWVLGPTKGAHHG
jgi:3-dehydroquinate dehydratase/shikimate dehydrogenase